MGLFHELDRFKRIYTCNFCNTIDICPETVYEAVGRDGKPYKSGQKFKTIRQMCPKCHVLDCITREEFLDGEKIK